jgi:peptide/nickel transport system substrate-binding protein
MRIKMLVSAICAIVGATLLIASATAAGSSASSSKAGVAKKGGTLQFMVPDGVFEDWDPGLAYDTLSWTMLHATTQTLLNYPEKPGEAQTKLYPEGASAFPKVSSDGKTYTFTIRGGQRFSDGSAVTAQSYKHAIDRLLSPKMGGGSPVGVNLALQDLFVGGAAMLDGKADTISGITAKGNTLTIKLVKAEPAFNAIVAMPWFAAVKANMPFSEEGVETYPSSGPYYLAENKKEQSKLLKRNTFYKGDRPAFPDQIVFTENIDENAALLKVKQGSGDITTPPAPEMGALGEEFGVNKGRFFVGSTQCNSYLALNSSAGRPTSALGIRKAVNWAIDRPAMIRVAGKYAGKRSAQILVPGVPGYKGIRAYSFKGANVAEAKKASGNSNATIKYVHRTTAGALARAQVFQYNLQQAGFKVQLEPIASRSQYFDTIGTRGADFDVASAGWCADYNDPFDWFNVLLDGKLIQEKNNVNLAYFNNASLNKKLDAASKLQGDARYAAYQKLDVDVTKNYAPWATVFILNSRFLVSARASNVIYSPYFTEPFIQAISVAK